jgi:Zn-dependent peptidase ImmA (M78 family)/transcriptional regulator with XRE-family HTH domain
MLELTKHRTGRRIKALREHHHLTQEALSNALGFADRQTLASIEAGQRAVAPAELVAVANALSTTVADLLDPYRLAEREAEFNFRTAEPVTGDVFREFEDTAGRWIATYREVGLRLGKHSNCLGKKLELGENASFEEIEAAAEALGEQWNLGDRPAERLQEAIERELNALVLYVDTPAGVSGAASYMAGLSTIMINRRETRTRRYFDLAHELFHLLTWDTMPPRRLELIEVKPAKGVRVEQLANKFAATLLMPERVIKQLWDATLNSDFAIRISCLAARLWVSPEALRFRLLNLGLLAARLLKEPVPTSLLESDDCPSLFSERFVRRVRDAVDHGYLSVRRAAGLLGTSLRDFSQLCEQYGCPLAKEA